MTSSIIPEESAAQDVEAPANTGDISRNRKLSTISKMYDIRGDGELDEAEMCVAWTPRDVGISRMKRCTS